MQSGIRRAYLSGGPGVAVSGLVWVVAWLIETRLGIIPAFAALFIGGALIFPLGLLIVRVMFKVPPVEKANTLGSVALESTFAMLGGFVGAFVLVHIAPEYAIPVVAIAVGTHYFAFRTLYGLQVYTVLAALITIVSMAAIFANDRLPISATLTVGVIELAFAVFILVQHTRQKAGAA